MKGVSHNNVLTVFNLTSFNNNTVSGAVCFPGNGSKFSYHERCHTHVEQYMSDNAMQYVL